MSKITIPLLMIVAAIAFFAMAKLDGVGAGNKKHRWPASTKPAEKIEEEAASEPIMLEPTLTAAEFERRTDRNLANIRLLPLADDAYPISFLWPTDTDDNPARVDLLEFAARDSFDQWKSFTDEDIGFFYPDFPGVHVEVISATDAIPLLAPTMLPPESGIEKKYRITAGENGTLCVISLARTDRFDDAPREPRPEIFYRYTQSGGGLMRTAFTEQGQVRRVEILGRGVRVSLLDWPHLAVHQDVYLRIASAIQLPRPYPKFRKLDEQVIATYQLEGKLGLLDHGMSEGEVTSLLGQPVARDPRDGTLQYFRTSGSRSIFYTLTMRQGLFAGFSDGWRQIARPAPVEGSVRWMFEKTSYHAGPAGGIGYDLGALTDVDAQAIFERFVELAPTAGPNDWELLCDTIANLAQHGLRDPRVIDIARARLEIPNTDPHPALLALQSCDSDLAKAAIAEHVVTQFNNTELPPETLNHCYTLIAYLGKGHPASAQLVDRALSHQSPAVRELGFNYCAWLPEQYSLPHLEAGLSDPAVGIRRSCATAFATSHGTKDRHPKILSIALANENDEEVRQLLKQALERLGDGGTGDGT